MATVSIAERRKCAICGDTATRQVSPDLSAYQIRRYSDAALERPYIPIEVTIPQEFCQTHFSEVSLGSRQVGLCANCKAWRPAGGVPCSKCGSALMLTRGAHRWSR